MGMVSSGNNSGRVGTIVHRERHPGSFEIVHVKDAEGHSFATRLQNVFVIGKGNKPWISLPKGSGIKLSIIEDRNAKMNKLEVLLSFWSASASCRDSAQDPQ